MPERRRADPLKGSETVLLAEDDDRVRGLIGSMLRKSGYQVIEATRGNEALDLAMQFAGEIDLLLTDVVMPNMSGRVLADRLKTVRPSTRVLYMSGYSDDAVLRHGVERDGVHFIQKPFSMDALAGKIRETLARQDERTNQPRALPLISRPSPRLVQRC